MNFRIVSQNQAMISYIFCEFLLIVIKIAHVAKKSKKCNFDKEQYQFEFESTMLVLTVSLRHLHSIPVNKFINLEIDLSSEIYLQRPRI